MFVFVCPDGSLGVCLSTCHTVYLSVCLSVRLAVCLSVYTVAVVLQILFGTDGFMYIFLGDGGGKGDPLGNAQNK